MHTSYAINTSFNQLLMESQTTQHTEGKNKPSSNAPSRSVKSDRAAIQRKSASHSGESSPVVIPDFRTKADGKAGTIQMKWISNGSAILRWDIPVKGVIWFYDVRSRKMYYHNQSGPAIYNANEGVKNGRPRSEWLKMRGGSDPLKHQDARVVHEDEVYTDSDSDSDDPTHDGVRLVEKGGKKKDKAEFDRLRLIRRKLYEDKRADFSGVPVEHRKPGMIKAWVKKQILGKVRSKIKAIHESNNGITVRCHEDTGKSAGFLIQWFQQTRQFKIVLAGDDPTLRNELRAAILQLRHEFPGWRITAKLNDPVALEDHKQMHAKKKESRK